MLIRPIAMMRPPILARINGTKSILQIHAASVSFFHASPAQLVSSRRPFARHISIFQSKPAPYFKERKDWKVTAKKIADAFVWVITLPRRIPRVPEGFWEEFWVSINQWHNAHRQRAVSCLCYVQVRSGSYLHNSMQTPGTIKYFVYWLERPSSAPHHWPLLRTGLSLLVTF